jgi:hypothetical protein
MTIALAVLAIAAVTFFLRILAALMIEASKAPDSAVMHLAKYSPGKRQRGVLLEMNIEEMNIETQRKDIPLRTREGIAL